MKLGVDLSSLDELEALNPVFTYKGEKVEPFAFFANHNHIKTVRLRIWNDPYDSEGNPYGGGTNDLERTIKLAKRAKAAGMNVLLDFHYSDFYTDPSRQIIPKAWRGKNFKQILEELSNFTKKTLLALKDNEIDVMGVQIGNEVTNGMLFPYGELSKEYSEENGGGFRGQAKILKTARDAVKEIYPNTKVILHLEHSGYYKTQDWFLSNILKYDFDFDVLGESYYPYWHAGLPAFKDTMLRIKEKYHKEIWIVEIGYEYIESYPDYKKDLPDVPESEFIIGDVNGRLPFPKTKQGQADYLKKLLEVCLEIGAEYAFYWEPCWIYMPHNGWAKPAGERYCGYEPTGEAGNNWVAYTFFDLEGKANPSLDVFSQDYVDSIKK